MAKDYEIELFANLQVQLDSGRLSSEVKKELKTASKAFGKEVSDEVAAAFKVFEAKAKALAVPKGVTSNIIQSAQKPEFFGSLSTNEQQKTLLGLAKVEESQRAFAELSAKLRGTLTRMANETTASTAPELKAFSSTLAKLQSSNREVGNLISTASKAVVNTTSNVTKDLRAATALQKRQAEGMDRAEKELAATIKNLEAKFARGAAAVKAGTDVSTLSKADAQQVQRFSAGVETANRKFSNTLTNLGLSEDPAVAAARATVTQLGVLGEQAKQQAQVSAKVEAERQRLSKEIGRAHV